MLEYRVTWLNIMRPVARPRQSTVRWDPKGSSSLEAVLSAKHRLAGPEVVQVIESHRV